MTVPVDDPCYIYLTRKPAVVHRARRLAIDYKPTAFKKTNQLPYIKVMLENVI